MKYFTTTVKASFAAVVLMLLCLGQASASWQEASQVVDQKTKEMLDLLHDESFKTPEREPELVAAIDQILSPVVDFDYISRVVMGKFYRRATPEQQQQFSSVFKTTLLKTYARAIVGFSISGYEIQPPKVESPEPGKQVVTVDVIGGNGARYALVYYMSKEESGWRLVNVLMDGVNLRLTFKNQFADIIQRSNNDVGQAIINWENLVDPDKKGDA
ncbi:ABC transporter substrate-binding protein [Neptuniibacter sp. CAU 1671]|uniref:MlaC/ttg2D family ABC transporter substrate-binding protein n=1 Tax=Neptuniibacter sp. CAU 1671 TaxID=3032593 RepID=UPI0023DC5BFE|nr:ABC transporter substrate-binding protein [Neptuniibacter sp. CAU 1671]MDF2182179.1 ABC transporter substrate-binding protein [Neptuniibacter sp. CAU 1671]